SLSAMRLVARAGEVLGVELSVRALFDAPTVRELVVAASSAGSALAPITAAVPRPERIPLSFAQQRMWFINQFDPGRATYNIPALLRLTGEIDEAALSAAVADLVSRHEILRTVYPSEDGVPYQQIAPADEVAARVHAVGDDALVRAASTRGDLEAAVTTGFDVTTDWPLRVRFWRADTDHLILAVVLHHIAGDGESMTPLVADLVTAYRARTAGRAPQFDPLDVQFADYAIWQQNALGDPADRQSEVGRELAFWTDQLADLPDVLNLPADRPRPLVMDERGAAHSFQIPAPVAHRVTRLAARAGATPFMVLHAALSVLLSRLSGERVVPIATPIAGRGRAQLDSLIGMFVNTLVLRCDIDPHSSFLDVLDDARFTDLEAFAHATVPFETVVDAVDPVRSESFAPLAQVMLAVQQGTPDTDALELEGLTVSAMPPPTVAAKVDLHLEIGIVDDQPWWASFVYATSLFDETTIADFAAWFVTLLGGLTAEPESAVGGVGFLSDRQRRGLLEASRGEHLTVDVGTLPDWSDRRRHRSIDNAAAGRSMRNVWVTSGDTPGEPK
ncbi:condensation domain-containing protein, partial [Gordonia sp. VNK21]|uniref:condensation domain-containing protein n=1 Tax=Gordonia sp. VNK21 TaxID=3382483 RepID=UPI0038D366C1